MGLDMMAGWSEQDTPDAKVVHIATAKPEIKCEFEWRKHARLQQFMMELYHTRKGEEVPIGVMGSFNAENLELFEEDLKILRELIINDELPFCPDGFFWGHQFQEEAMREYKEQDLLFCERALQWIAEAKEYFILVGGNCQSITTVLELVSHLYPNQLQHLYVRARTPLVGRTFALFQE